MPDLKPTEVFARKYRPTKLSDLVGQGHVAQTLQNAFNGDMLHHAYLFTGAFGSGKTSCARIVAAMLNCENKKGSDPCGECDTCKQIFEGLCTDVKEMNAASNRGIDDVKNLVDYVSIRPLLCKWKVVILDECHALTRDAVESSLKLIEEPPQNVIFILCTTDPQKMKMTIHSRCIPFRFSKVAWPEILIHLKNLAEKENIKADEGALRIAAKLSKGSMRNAVNNLHLLMTFSGGSLITAELAQQAFGSVCEEDFFTFIDAIVTKDVPSGMKTIHNFFEQGQDLEQVMNGLMGHLRNLLVLVTCSNTTGLLYLSDEEKKRYIHQYKKVSINLIVYMIELLCENTRWAMVNVNPQTIYEHYLVKSIMKQGEIERSVKTG